MKKRIVFTGGGTGGHVMPNLALIPYFSHDYDVHYVGSIGGVEKELVRPLEGVTYHEIPCVKLRRSLSLQNLTIPFKLYKSVRCARALLDELQPSLIFSKGGFVGLPLALACRKIPLILHESDSSIGLANRLALKKAEMLLTAFDTISHKKATCVGAPLRPALYRADRSLARKKLGIETVCKPVLLVTGGSLGAKALNDFVFASLPALTARFFVLHLTGKNETRHAQSPFYRAMAFDPNIADLYAAADFVLTRGGANALFELMALQKPCVCVPLEKATRGDQIVNAKYFADKGALVSLSEKRLTPLALFDAINTLSDKKSDFLNSMRSVKADGTEKIVSILGEKLRQTGK